MFILSGRGLRRVSDFGLLSGWVRLSWLAAIIMSRKGPEVNLCFVVKTLKVYLEPFVFAQIHLSFPAAVFVHYLHLCCTWSCPACTEPRGQELADVWRRRLRSWWIDAAGGRRTREAAAGRRRALKSRTRLSLSWLGPAASDQTQTNWPLQRLKGCLCGEPRLSVEPNIWQKILSPEEGRTPRFEHYFI